MGSLIVESIGVSTVVEEIIAENDFKDNKKKKRRSRKSKQTPSGNLFLFIFLCVVIVQFFIQ